MSLQQKFILEFMTTADITKEEFEAIITQSLLQYEMNMNENGLIRCHVHELDPDREDRLILDNYNRGHEDGKVDAKNIQTGLAYQRGLEDGRAELRELKDQLSRIRYPDTTGQ